MTREEQGGGRGTLRLLTLGLLEARQPGREGGRTPAPALERAARRAAATEHARRWPPARHLGFARKFHFSGS